MDHPLDECIKDAAKLIGQGAKVYQKFTCSGCGTRLTIDKPNVFYATGTCDNCDAITDIVKQGCNYMVLFGF